MTKPKNPPELSEAIRKLGTRTLIRDGKKGYFLDEDFVEGALAQREECEEELLEQARLIGKSGTRELELLTEIRELRANVKELESLQEMGFQLELKYNKVTEELTEKDAEVSEALTIAYMQGREALKGELADKTAVIEDLIPIADEYYDKIGDCGCDWPPGSTCPAHVTVEQAKAVLAKYPNPVGGEGE